MKKINKPKKAVPNYGLDAGKKIKQRNIEMKTLIEQARDKDSKKVRNKKSGTGS